MPTSVALPPAPVTPRAVAAVPKTSAAPGTTAPAVPRPAESGAGRAASEGSASGGAPEPGAAGDRIQPKSAAAAPPGTSGATGGAKQTGASTALDSLNDRLKRLSASGDVDYAPKRVALGDAQAILDSAIAAYELRLAPPPEILSRTFGVIYERRSSSHADSIAYIYDTYAIGPITMCKAWKIVEHPYQPVREVGAVAGNAGIGGGVVTSANSPVVRHDNGGSAEIQTVAFPCTKRSYTAIRRGSLRAPLPRRPDAPGTIPAATFGTPAPAASLAP